MEFSSDSILLPSSADWFSGLLSWSLRSFLFSKSMFDDTMGLHSKQAQNASSRDNALNSAFLIFTQLLQNHLSQKLQLNRSGFELSPESHDCLHLVQSQCPPSPTSSLVTFFTTLPDMDLFTSESAPAPSCFWQLGTEAPRQPAWQDWVPSDGSLPLPRRSTFRPQYQIQSLQMVFNRGYFWSSLWERFFRELRKIRISRAPEPGVECRYFVLFHFDNITICVLFHHGYYHYWDANVHGHSFILCQIYIFHWDIL